MPSAEITSYKPCRNDVVPRTPIRIVRDGCEVLFQNLLSPRQSVAPTQFVPVIRRNPSTAGRELSQVRWGLVPSWAKDSSKAAAMINARSETAASKPAFYDALKFRRCLIPADGFYEWQKVGKARQPYCFEVNRGEIFSFAGLWETWWYAQFHRSPLGERRNASSSRGSKRDC